MNKSKFKAYIATILCVIMLCSTTAFAANTQKTVTAVYNNIKIVVDGISVVPSDVNGNVVDPFIIDGTTYLPVRALANALGQGVNWNQETSTVTIGGQPDKVPAPSLQSAGKGSQSVEVTTFYNDIKIVVNDEEITPKDVNGNIVEPFIIDGTTYLPVRALANALGEDVSWDSATNTVYIGTTPFKVDAQILKQFANETLATVGSVPVKGAFFNILVAQNCNSSSFQLSCDNYESGKTLQNLTMNSQPVTAILRDFISEEVYPVFAIYEYAENNGFVQKEETQSALKSIYDSYLKQFSSDEEFNAFLNECGITASDYEQFVKITSVYTLFTDDLYARYLSIPYDSSELSKISEERYVTAKHILVPDEQTAMDIIGKIGKGTSFDTLSDEYNMDPGATSSGYTFTRNQMVKEFEDAVYALKENEYTKSPVKSTYGYHVILRLPLDKEWIKSNESTIIQSIAADDTYTVIDKILSQADVSTTDQLDRYFSTIK